MLILHPKGDDLERRGGGGDGGELHNRDISIPITVEKHQYHQGRRVGEGRGGDINMEPQEGRGRGW